MEKNLISTHRLVSDHSIKGKMKSLITGWSIFLLILIVTQLPPVKSAMLRFSESVDINWVTSAVNFVINYFWILGIAMISGTIVTLLKKSTFDTIRVYDTGIGFWDSENENERYADYSDIKLSYGKMRQSFWVEAKSISLKLTDYGWKEFSQPDVLQNNLERYGKWI